jgi:hypothetical protein
LEVITPGEFVFKSNIAEEPETWETFEYPSLSIIGKPGEFNLKSILKFDEHYDSSSPVLTFELTQSSTSFRGESLK